MADTVCVSERRVVEEGKSRMRGNIQHCACSACVGLRGILRRGPDQPLGFVVLGVFWAFSSCTLRPSRTDRSVREEWPRIY